METVTVDEYRHTLSITYRQTQTDRRTDGHTQSTTKHNALRFRIVSIISMQY